MLEFYSGTSSYIKVCGSIIYLLGRSVQARAINAKPIIIPTIPCVLEPVNIHEIGEAATRIAPITIDIMAKKLRRNAELKPTIPP